MSIQHLLHPTKVALIGASEKNGFAGWTAQNLLANADRCPVYFVNPTKAQVFGQPCYPSLEALPELVDCIVLAVARDRVNAYLEEAGRLGIHAAVVYASGYSEEHSEEGRALEAEMKEIAARYDMSILGPNCMGLVNKVDGINLLGMRANPPGPFPGKRPCIALMGHSGALLANLALKEGFPLAYMVSVGNGTVTCLEEFIEYCAESPDISVITLYLEGLKRPDIFVHALQIAAQRKLPVVILKTGRSARTAASAASHTGSLAGSYKSFKCMCEKFGAILVDSLEELVCMSEMLATLDGNYPKIPKMVSMNSSGGFNTLATECIDANGIALSEFSEETKAEICRYLPGYATLANPLDTTTTLLGDPERMLGILRAMEHDDDIGLISVGVDIGDKHGGFGDFVMVEAMERGRTEGLRKPYFVTGLLEKTKNTESRRILSAEGICLMPSLPTATRCIRKMLDFVNYDPAAHDLRTEGMPSISRTGQVRARTEMDSKVILAQYGIPTTRSVLITEKDQIRTKTEFRYPVVMKVSSEDIPHKTDAGAVIVNVASVEDAMTAFDTILSNSRAFKPDARIEGVLLQEMAPKGTEIILGTTCDPQLGPMVMVGLGGIFVEVFQDAALMPAPVNRAEAMHMLESLKAYKIIKGYRGMPALDMDALAEAIVNLSQLAYEKRDTIREIDVNPVFVYPKGICAVDALVVEYSQPNNEDGRN